MINKDKDFEETIKKIEIEIENYKSQILMKQEEKEALINKERTEKRNRIILTYILQKIDKDPLFKEQLYYEIQTNYKNEEKDILSDLFYIEQFNDPYYQQYIDEIGGCDFFH